MYKIIGIDGKEYGPVNLDQMRQWLAQGRINSQTRIKAEDASEWRTASEVPEIAALFAVSKGTTTPAMPPPLSAPAPSVQRKGLAVLSFVLGLSSFVLCLSAVTGIPAIIF